MQRKSPYRALGDDESLFVMESVSPQNDRLVHFGANFKLGQRSCSPNEEEFHLDIRAIDVEAEMRLFEEKCAPGIAACRAFYKGVKLSWGVHQYCR